MRWDITGLFWDDYVAPRIPVEKVKRTPPDPVWLKDDYLPGLEEARAYQFDLMSDAEVLNSKNDTFTWDTEIYPNYVLIGARSMTTKKIVKFELHDGATIEGVEKQKAEWIFKNLLLVGFNDNEFDWPLMSALLAGYTTNQLADAADELVNGGPLGRGMRAYEFYREHKLKAIPGVNNIDLIQLTPTGPSLKKCAGRLHSQRMADLPFPPGRNLLPDQKLILRHYWVNDLEVTHLLYDYHKPAIELRELIGEEYKVDVRSKSDPQVAEEVIRAEIKRLTGRKYIQSASIRTGHVFRYQPPGYIAFKTQMMREVFAFVCLQNFVIDGLGSPEMPEDLSGLDIVINRTTYRVGMGGLHSQEKRMVHYSDEFYELSDNDVTSYYPTLMIKQGMYPPHVGPEFLTVFNRILVRRVAAKEAGDKGTAETLKIVLNGTFGKTGERGGHSVVYYPEMMIQVTVTGQLSLLMLIEQLELAGIQVVSANTDGIVIKCPRHLLDQKAAIIAEWQNITGLNLESTGYKAVRSRDVNNYMALYEKPKVDKKTGKVEYAKRIGAYRETLNAVPLKWNPTCDICSNAVELYLATGKSIEQTIYEERDFRKFLEVRSVTGGAVKDGVFLGKVIRWYYATGVVDEIINAKNGNIIPRSKGGKPCMTLPVVFPDDIDYPYYVERAMKILEELTEKAA